MSGIGELIDEGKRHYLVLNNRAGKTLIRISLLWTVIIFIVQPQLLAMLLILAVFEIIDIQIDDTELSSKILDKSVPRL